MSEQALKWTDALGRTYEYTPHRPALLADAEFEFSSEVTLGLAEAARVLGAVPKVPMSGMATVLYRSESSASSLIEGVGPGARRILEAEFGDVDELDDEPARRVVGNLEALKVAISTPVPAGVEDILHWHELLMEGHPRIRPEAIGSLRTQQNWIGGDVFGPRDAEYIPPPPDVVPQLLEDLVGFCGRTDLTPVALAALAHAQFEVIHPFVDGNGRVGRVLLQQLLVKRSGLDVPIPVSVPWSRDTEPYIGGLRAFQEGDSNSWLLFACWSVIEALGWLSQVTHRLERLLDHYRTLVKTRGKSVTAMVIDDLPTHPIVDTPSVATRYDVTPQTAHAALVRLAEAGILTERSFARRKKEGRPRRVFAATGLMDVLGGS
ncbi:MAG TPA: Fic family protein [Acidimicrobiia bacterium]|nr:Fic family protein [Acidimicrobiia bacterium]